MRKWISLLMVLALVVSFSIPAFAGNKNDLAYKNFDELDATSSLSSTDELVIFQSGVPTQGTTVAALQQVDMVGGGTTSITGYTVGVEVHNTTDMTVVLASETGKTFIAKQNTKFQLPTAAEGLTYTFIAGAAIELQVQVSTTPNTIVFMDADGSGNGVIETGGTNTTGNSVTLVADGSNWYVTKSTGTWETGGAWIALDMGAQS
ncbi:MAG: hypothetical protein PHT95_06845 [Candidatus Omnitrophica bacterium]|nr:hypothetical protein [Candidatus Omnitrophota bacterium]